MTATSHKPAGHFHLPRMRTHAGTAVTEATAVRYVWALARISLGFVFLWAFLDKTFGLGHETTDKAAWINGGSPTNGFLSKGTSGPLADFYQSFAGATWADWLFMLGLAGIGTALILGIGMRIAATTGALLLIMMWSAALPPANSIFMDDHLIYALLIIGLALASAGDTLGLGTWWKNTKITQSYPILK